MCVKWALGIFTTNKINGGDGIPIELFQILKDDAVKVRPPQTVILPFCISFSWGWS